MKDTAAEPALSTSTNDQLVLISGESASGKSASLMNIRNQERWLYLNCEGKRLPFRSKFLEHRITDPYDVFDAFEATEEGGELHGDIDGIIIDSITFCMDLFESKYIRGAADTQKWWGEYGQFYKNLLQIYIARSDLAVILLGHTKIEYDEKAMLNRVSLNIKGSVGKNGPEAYFSTVVSTKKIEIKELGDYDKELLHVSEEDEALGYKHVFQTRLTRATTGERIRSPMGMFTPAQTYMDNDAQLLLDYLDSYYNGA